MEQSWGTKRLIRNRSILSLILLVSAILLAYVTNLSPTSLIEKSLVTAQETSLFASTSSEYDFIPRSEPNWYFYELNVPSYRSDWRDETRNSVTRTEFKENGFNGKSYKYNSIEQPPETYFDTERKKGHTMPHIFILPTTVYICNSILKILYSQSSTTSTLTSKVRAVLLRILTIIFLKARAALLLILEPFQLSLLFRHRSSPRASPFRAIISNTFKFFSPQLPVFFFLGSDGSTNSHTIRCEACKINFKTVLERDAHTAIPGQVSHYRCCVCKLKFLRTSKSRHDKTHLYNNSQNCTSNETPQNSQQTAPCTNMDYNSNNVKEADQTINLDFENNQEIVVEDHMEEDTPATNQDLDDGLENYRTVDIDNFDYEIWAKAILDRNIGKMMSKGDCQTDKTRKSYQTAELNRANKMILSWMVDCRPPKRVVNNLLKRMGSSSLFKGENVAQSFGQLMNSCKNTIKTSEFKTAKSNNVQYHYRSVEEALKFMLDECHSEMIWDYEENQGKTKLFKFIIWNNNSFQQQNLSN